MTVYPSAPYPPSEDGPAPAARTPHTQADRWATWYGPDVTPEMATTADSIYAAAVGVPPGSSPGSTGTRLMDALTRPRMRREPVEWWPAPALQSTTVVDPAWVRPLTRDEHRRRFVHSYDKNGQYLAACSSVELGLGGLTQLAPPGAISVAPRLPGYWLVEGRWLTTPTVLLATGQGQDVVIDDAYAWQRHGRALEPWYERLRDARTRLMGATSPAGKLAYRALKLTYTQGIGWLSGYWHDPHSPRYRPDWRHAIIATAAANTQRTVDRLDGAVVAVLVDQLYVTSDSPDATLAGRGLGLRMGEGLGAYKVRYRAIPLEVVRDAFDNPDVRELERRCRACVQS